MKAHWTAALRKLKVCGEAATWAKDYDTPQAAWDACERADWMLWLAGRFSGEPMSDARRPFVLAACACARTAQRHIPKGEKCQLAAIELAERWARGDESVTREMLCSASVATYAAACAAYNYKAHDVAYAAYAASAAAHDDAVYVDYAAYAGNDGHMRKKVLAEMARAVREHIPRCPLLMTAAELREAIAARVGRGTFCVTVEAWRYVRDATPDWLQDRYAVWLATPYCATSGQRLTAKTPEALLAAVEEWVRGRRDNWAAVEVTA